MLLRRWLLACAVAVPLAACGACGTKVPEVEPPPRCGQSWESGFMRGLCRRNGTFVTVLDLERLFKVNGPDWPGLELAWILEKASWGQGLAFEACSAIRAACAGFLRERPLVSLIYPDNAPSIRLAGRLGAVADGEVQLMGATLLRFRHRAPDPAR